MPEILPALLIATPMLALVATRLPAFESELAPIARAVAALIAVFGALLVARIAAGGDAILLHHLILADPLSAFALLAWLPPAVIALLGMRAYAREVSHPERAGTAGARDIYGAAYASIAAGMLAAMTPNLLVLCAALVATTGAPRRLVRRRTDRTVPLARAGVGALLAGLALVALSGRAHAGGLGQALDWPDTYRRAQLEFSPALRAGCALLAAGALTLAGVLPLRSRAIAATYRLPVALLPLVVAGPVVCALILTLRTEALVLRAASPGAGYRPLAAAGAALALAMLPGAVRERDLRRFVVRAWLAASALAFSGLGISNSSARQGALLLALSATLSATGALAVFTPPVRAAGSSRHAAIHAGSRGRAALTIGALLALGSAPLTGGGLGVLWILLSGWTATPRVTTLIAVAAAALLAATSWRALLLASARGGGERPAGGERGALWPGAVCLTATIALGVHPPSGILDLLRHAAMIAGGGR